MAKINTILADGHDVQRVNLWDNHEVDKRKKINGFSYNDTQVEVIDEIGDYFRVHTVGFQIDEMGEKAPVRIDGWCRKEFIKDLKA